MVHIRHDEYELRAIVSYANAAKKIVAMSPRLRLLPLSQGLALIPLVGDLARSAFCLHHTSDQAPGGAVFEHLSPGVYHALRLASLAEPTAYIELTRCFDEERQSAMIWAGPWLAYGPISRRTAAPGASCQEPDGPVEVALDRLSALPVDGLNLISSVGLDQYGSTADWYHSAPQRARHDATTRYEYHHEWPTNERRVS